MGISCQVIVWIGKGSNVDIAAALPISILGVFSFIHYKPHLVLFHRLWGDVLDRNNSFLAILLAYLNP